MKNSETPFSYFSSLTDVRAQPRSYDLHALVQTPLVTPVKEKAPLYSPALYNGTPHRASVNVVGMSAVVLDFDNSIILEKGKPPVCIDNPDTLEDILEQLPGVALVWHTTWSNKPEWPKFRVILPLDVPVHPCDFSVALQSVIRLCGSPRGVDHGCKDLSRAYFVPACTDAELYQGGAQEGDRLTLDYLADLAGRAFLTPADLSSKPASAASSLPAPTVGTTPGRNNALKAIAAAMLERGETVNAILSELIKHDNENHTPPLFGDPSESQYSGLPPELCALKFFSSVSISINQQRSAAGLAPEVPRLCEVSPPAPEVGQYVSVSELLNNPIKVEWVIHKRIEANTTGYTFGPPGGGKTFEALHRWLCVASGIYCNGHRTTQGIVLYCCGEGHSGISRRARAWMNHHDMTPEELTLFHVSRGTVGLEGKGVEQIIAEANALQELYGMPIKGIVVDTVARHLHGDENSTRDMNEFISALDRLRSAFPGSVAEGIHHCGHTSGRGRGSSALKGAVDFEFEVDAGLITCHKMKDSEKPEPQEFELIQVPVGIDDDGEEITSCIVEYGERSPLHRQAGITAQERMAVSRLLELSAKQQVTDSKGRFGAFTGDWRDEFYKAKREEDPEVKTGTLRQTFLRLVKSLTEKKIVSDDGKSAFLISGAYQDDINIIIFSNKLVNK
jgi:AAA domain